MKILEKACIGKVEIKNRVVMAPMNVGALNNSDGTFLNGQSNILPNGLKEE